MAIISPLTYTIANGQAVDATPLMADLNQIVSNVNANAAALAGSSSQVFNVANATTPAEAVNLGQFEQKTRYTTNQSGSINPISLSTTYTVSSQSVTFPAFSKTGAFRVRAVLIVGYTATANAVSNTFSSALTDGTNTETGADWLTYAVSNSYGGAVSDAIDINSTYTPGSTVTFSHQVTAGGGSASFSIASCVMRLIVEEA